MFVAWEEWRQVFLHFISCCIERDTLEQSIS